MKKTFVVVLFIASLHNAKSQSLFFKLGAGYAFPLGSEYIGEDHTSIYLKETNPQSGNLVPALISTNKVVKGTYNSGVMASGSFGLLFSDNIGLEVGLAYTHGKKIRTTSLHQDIIDDNVINMSGESTTVDVKNFIITPSVRFTTTEDRLIKPFVTAGPAIGLVNVKSGYQRVSDYDDEQSSVRHEKYSGGISIGFRSAAGVDLKLSDRLSVYTEMTVVALSYYPGEKEITKYEVDSVDALQTLSERQRKTRYVNNYEQDSRTYEDPNNRPEQALRFSFNMNSIGVTAGLRVSL